MVQQSTHGQQPSDIRTIGPKPQTAETLECRRWPGDLEAPFRDVGPRVEARSKVLWGWGCSGSSLDCLSSGMKSGDAPGFSSVKHQID